MDNFNVHVDNHAASALFLTLISSAVHVTSLARNTVLWLDWFINRDAASLSAAPVCELVQSLLTLRFEGARSIYDHVERITQF